jgi:hypothetical protein
MESKVIQLDLIQQVRAATYELGVRKFPDLVLIEGRDLNKDVERKLMNKYKEKSDKLTRLMAWKPYIFN